MAKKTRKSPSKEKSLQEQIDKLKDEFRKLKDEFRKLKDERPYFVQIPNDPVIQPFVPRPIYPVNPPWPNPWETTIICC